jgi:hypothetical protein
MTSLAVIDPAINRINCLFLVILNEAKNPAVFDL